MRAPSATPFTQARDFLYGAVALACFALAGCQPKAVENTPPQPTVGVVESRRMTVPVEVTPNGTTRSLEHVTIRARVRGFLTERHFAEGAVVKKGQLLFVIDEEPYQVALRAARARQAEAAAALRKAEQFRGREVSAAELEVSQAQLWLAQLQERRNSTLVLRKAGPVEDLEKAEADRKRWEAQVAADRAKLDQAKADFAVGISTAQAQVAVAQSTVRDAELNLGYCRMYAPIEGRIGEAHVKVGNLVGPEPAGGGAFTDLATIQQLDPMGIDVHLSSRELDRTTALVEHGLNVRLARAGPAGPQEHPFEGRGYMIDNTVDETTSTFLVKATIPNPSGTLLPGEYVKVRMVVERLEGAVVVPAASVVESESGTIVHIVDAQGKVAARQVVAGQAYNGLRVITRGLDSGASVIVEGLQMIRPGLEVKAQPAASGQFAPGGTKITAAADHGPAKS